MSEYQEEVLTNLLDLQAELRGDEPEIHDELSGTTSGADDTSPDAVSVTEEGLTVSSHSSVPPLGVNERLTALNERLAQLEYDLASVTKRIERIEPVPEVESISSADTDVDARWRSFLDLQKIVADRLDQR